MNEQNPKDHTSEEHNNPAPTDGQAAQEHESRSGEPEEQTLEHHENGGAINRAAPGASKEPPAIAGSDADRLAADEGKKKDDPKGEETGEKDEFTDMTNAELEAYADEHTIDLEGATKKADMQAKLRAAKEAKKD